MSALSDGRLHHDAGCEAGRPVGDTYTVNGCDCAVRELAAVRAERDNLWESVRNLTAASLGLTERLAAAHAALREACARYCAGCRAGVPLEWVDPIRRVRKEDERPSWYHRLRPDDHPNGGLLDHCDAVELRMALSTPEGM